MIINLFGSTEDMKKNSGVAEKAGWATTHFPALGHDTMCCIVTNMACERSWARMARHDKIGQARWGAQQGLRHSAAGPCDTAGLHAGRVATHTRGLATGVRRDTKFCIVAEGRPLCRDTACDTAPNALRYGAGALRHVLRSAMRAAGN